MKRTKDTLLDGLELGSSSSTTHKDVQRDDCEWQINIDL